MEPSTEGHLSDCATNNAPALPVGPCDCGHYGAVLDTIKQVGLPEKWPEGDDINKDDVWAVTVFFETQDDAIAYSNAAQKHT